MLTPNPTHGMNAVANNLQQFDRLALYPNHAGVFQKNHTCTTCGSPCEFDDASDCPNRCGDVLNETQTLLCERVLLTRRTDCGYNVVCWFAGEKRGDVVDFACTTPDAARRWFELREAEMVKRSNGYALLLGAASMLLLLSVAILSGYAMG